MLPKFGCNLQKYMFQPLDADIFRAIKKEILYSCQNYLQGASVIKLKVLKGNDIGKWGESSLHSIHYLILITSFIGELVTKPKKLSL